MEGLAHVRDLKSLHIFLAVVSGAAIIGFFVGTDPRPKEEPRLAPQPPQLGAAPHSSRPVPSYAALRDQRPGPNAGWGGDLEALRDEAPRPVLPQGPERDEARGRDLAARAERRAYDGAPPTIPHPVGQSQRAECLACHLEGLRVGERVASAMSHEPYGQCTQCHVPSVSPLPFDSFAGQARPHDGNRFVGLEAVPVGERAWAGAPPTMPHKTLMRTVCGSCHGTYGAEGLRTSHAERQNCLQCHAPSAALDQRASGVSP